MWAYLDSAGAPLGFVCRFDKKAGKQFRPLVLFEPAGGGAAKWRWESWPAPRPLYGQDRLAARPRAGVVLCEGEKAADAAGKLLVDHVCIASPNGAKSAAKADWSPLEERDVTIWPDADSPGGAYAQEAAGLAVAAGARSVSIIAPPATAGEGWDAADALDEGWTKEMALGLVDAAARLETAFGERAKSAEGGKSRRRRSQRDDLMALAQFCALWRGPDYETFASIDVGGHQESWPIRSQAFKRWLSLRAYESCGLAPGAQAIEDTVRVLEARASSEGKEQAPWRRVGGRDGKLYVDLCDAAWRAVEIASDGWRVLEKHDLPFIRSPRMRPLCEPEAGYSIDELRHFGNLAGEDDFVIVVAWLIAALRERGPYPILILNGEQGSGKSSFCRLLRSLIDPSSPAIQGPPKDEQNLIVTAQNGHLIAFDNLSHIDATLSDGLCRLSTGSGFAVRALHTDKDENIFDGARPIVINGIPALAERADLNDRSIIARLSSIPEESRRPEDEIERDWEIARPRVLGALYDALSAALRRIGSVRLPRSSRMADFEKWLAAAEPGLGWEPGAFSEAYERGRRDSADAAFESDVIAVAIDDFIRREDLKFWSGTATQLLGLLAGITSESIRQMRIWPKTAQGLGNCLERCIPLLRTKGIMVERRHSGVRTITIARSG